MFGPDKEWPLGTFTGGFALGDLDSDGALDLAATNFVANRPSCAPSPFHLSSSRGLAITFLP